MLCKSPFMIGPLPCACQRCMPCRINKKRIWTFRLELEAKKHLSSCVVTLTYNRVYLPEGGSLVPFHAQAFLKRLRTLLAPKKIRYFLVGEYGEDSFRPHYHVLLFGLGAHVAGGLDGRSGLVKQAWKYGYVYVDECSSEAISYVAGYVTKKLTQNERDLKQLTPEFTRMSLRPGIGAGAVEDIARVLRTDVGLASIALNGDVPHALRHGTKLVSIGRYLRGKLRKSVMGSSEQTADRKKAYWQEMWALRKKAEDDPSRKAKKFSQYLVDMNAQKMRNLEARTKIFVGKHTF